MLMIDDSSSSSSSSSSILAATTIIENATENSATGVLFSGKAFRSFAGWRRFMPGWEEEVQEKLDRNVEVDQQQQALLEVEHEQCDQWAVVTTISAPTEAIKVAVELPGWCTVVVVDTKTPLDFVEQLANLTTTGDKKKMIHFLSVEDKEQWGKRSGGAIGEFVHSNPYKHFAQKNIGYLYANQQGAKIIFHFVTYGWWPHCQPYTFGKCPSSNFGIHSVQSSQAHEDHHSRVMGTRLSFGATARR
jgi:hypothetical protein